MNDHERATSHQQACNKRAINDKGEKEMTTKEFLAQVIETALPGVTYLIERKGDSGVRAEVHVGIGQSIQIESYRLAEAPLVVKAPKQQLFIARELAGDKDFLVKLLTSVAETNKALHRLEQLADRSR